MTQLTAKTRNALDDAKFAFPSERKMPIENASHVRNAIARFNQVEDVSDAERDAAWKRIRAAAKTHGVEVSESGWREMGKPTARKPAAGKTSARKTAASKTAASKTAASKSASGKTSSSKPSASATGARKPRQPSAGMTGARKSS